METLEDLEARRRQLLAERREPGAFSIDAMCGLLEAHRYEREVNDSYLHVDSWRHVGDLPRWWACESLESAPPDAAWFHGACRACVLLAASLAVNRFSRQVLAYIGHPNQPSAEYMPIRLSHYTAFYDAMRERHGLPMLLHIDDRVFARSWS